MAGEWRVGLAQPRASKGRLGEDGGGIRMF